ncbi:hypothetical protein INR49_008678 [Caranx melampygus]|nr:hypothetical protein INR49_008678 [Caranx melampygus]
MYSRQPAQSAIHRKNHLPLLKITSSETGWEDTGLLTQACPILAIRDHGVMLLLSAANLVYRALSVPLQVLKQGGSEDSAAGPGATKLSADHQQPSPQIPLVQSWITPAFTSFRRNSFSLDMFANSIAGHWNIILLREAKQRFELPYQPMFEDHVAKPLEVQSFKGRKDKERLGLIAFRLLDGSLWIVPESLSR